MGVGKRGAEVQVLKEFPALPPPGALGVYLTQHCPVLVPRGRFGEQDRGPEKSSGVVPRFHSEGRELFEIVKWVANIQVISKQF
jgi:hypothetical protein